jgi:hypothetical protein
VTIADIEVVVLTGINEINGQETVKSPIFSNQTQLPLKRFHPIIKVFFNFIHMRRAFATPLPFILT